MGFSRGAGSQLSTRGCAAAFGSAAGKTPSQRKTLTAAHPVITSGPQSCVLGWEGPFENLDLPRSPSTWDPAEFTAREPGPENSPAPSKSLDRMQDTMGPTVLTSLGPGTLGTLALRTSMVSDCPTAQPKTPIPVLCPWSSPEGRRGCIPTPQFSTGSLADQSV